MLWLSEWIVDMPSLQSINIGQHNMIYVKNFLINGLESLQTLSIDYRSFYSVSSGSCSISNCPLLSSIYLGGDVFEKYKYFVLQNVPSLQSITMSYDNFVSSTVFDINRISLLQSIIPRFTWIKTIIKNTFNRFLWLP